MRLTTALVYTLLVVDVALSDDSSYTYQFQMDLSTPLFAGQLDECIGWHSSVSPTNHTWYGISFQLPEDSKILDGGWSNTSPAQPLKEDGYEQMFNDTASGVVKYNFTTSADRPVIRTRVNGNLFTYTADFADGSNYDEHGTVYSVICEVSESADGLIIKYATVVVPTMTVSLKRLSGPALTAAPTPEPTSSSCMTGSFFAMTALASASSAFLLL